MDQALQDPGDLVGQRHDRAGGERRVHPPGEEAEPALAARLLPAGARQLHHRGLPHCPAQLRAELRRLLSHLLPATGQGQVRRRSRMQTPNGCVKCGQLIVSSTKKRF